MSPAKPPDDNLVRSLVAQTLEAERRGAPVARDALIREYPEHAELICELLARHDQQNVDDDVFAATLPPQSSAVAKAVTHESGSPAADDSTRPPSGMNRNSEEQTLASSSPAIPVPEPAIGNNVRYFGEYELIEEIARGGMGVVYKARQINLNRIVALKMILAGQFAGEADVQRFYTEAEAAAQLDHPGIVPIFEIGEHGGQHYFSMGYIEGQSLADRVAEGPMSAKTAAELCARICEAMAYAHERGVIHRDLKPANILLDSAGQPKVTDFGLAKRTETDSGLTGTGQILGTPSYMPPEQASGKVDEVGPLADVYSLGAILYNTLTGRPPFQAANPMDTLLQVLESDPIAPRQLNPAVDEDLQTVCLKALEKQPGRRYGSAQQLLDELRRYLAGEPIVARPIGRVERTWRWCKRKPALAGLLAVVASFLLLLSIGGPFVAIQQAEFAQQQLRLKSEAELSRDEAEGRREEAETARAQAESAQQRVEKEQKRVAGLLYATRISLAYREWLDSNPVRAQQLLNECPLEERNWEWTYLDDLTRAEELSIFAHNFPASVEFFPSGNALLTRGIVDNQFKKWDTGDGLEQYSQGVRDLRSVNVPIDDDHFLIVAGPRIRYVGTTEGEQETFGDFGVRATAGLLFAKGTRVATAFADGTIVLYRRPSGREIYRTPQKLISERPHVFAPNGRTVAGTENMTVKVWDVKTGETRFEIVGHGMSIEDITFSPDSALIASVDRAGSLIITDVKTGHRLQKVAAHAGGVKSVAFSSDGSRIATGSMDRTCRIFDVTSGAELLTIRGHTAPILDIAFDPTGNRIATAAMDGTARIWRIGGRINTAPEVQNKFREQKIAHMGHSPGLESRLFYGHLSPVYDVAISPDSRFVATSAADPTQHSKYQIKVWSLEDSSLYASFPVPSGYLHTLTYSNDSKYLFVASGGAGDVVSQAAVVIWDMETKKQFRSIDGIACMLTRAVLNKENDLLAVAFGNLNYGKLRSYSFPQCELLHEKDVTGERLSAIAFSATGDELLSTSAPGGRVSIWNARTGKESAGFVAHGSGVFQIAVSNNDLLAAAHIDGNIGIWDWKNRKQLGVLHGHSNYAVDVDFSPDGKRLVSSSEDETVKVWDLSHFSELLSFRDHVGPALGTDWSNDGRFIASASRDGAMIIRHLNDVLDGESVGQWVTVFEDNFDREELGPQWGGSGGSIENGKLVGTLQPIPTAGSSFPGAFLSLTSIDLPRSVEVCAEVTLRQPMLAQLVLSNRRTTQYIAPFIASTTKPYNFTGSAVQVARGEGQENKMLGSRSNVRLEPGITYEMRVVREIDDLRFYLNDRLIEHVRVPTLEADLLQLSGCFSELGDQISFDNLRVRIPARLVRQQEIRRRIGDWLSKILVPELVEKEISDHYSDSADRKLAEAMLRQLSAGHEVKLAEILQSFSTVAMRSDATETEYQIALRQAKYYFQRRPDRWQMGKVGLAMLRGGEVEEALKVFDRGIAENMAGSGHAFGLLYAGRALALHELGRDEEARIEHHRFLDSNVTNLGNNNPMPKLAAELKEKIPVVRDPLRQSLIEMLLRRDKAFWYTRDMREAYRDTSLDYRMVQGRGPKPGPYDRVYDRETAMKLDAIYSSSNPPPQLTLLWRQIEFARPDEQHATIEWIAISKIEGMIFRFGQRYEFAQRNQNWRIVGQRTWQIDRRINNQWQRQNDQHWAQLDQRLEEMKATRDPALARTLIAAMRFDEALETASQLAEANPDHAANLAILGEAAITLGRFREGISVLEKARHADPNVQMPWFLNRVKRVFSDHKPNPYGLDFHPTEEFMVTAHHDRALVLWNLDQRRIAHTFVSAHGQVASDAVFSQDGSQVYSVGFDRLLNIFDLKSGQRVGQLPGHLGTIFRIERHPTEDVVVTASADRTAKIWDMNKRQELITLSGHSNSVMGASFSPTGNRVATASSDGTVRLWDASTGRELATLNAHERGAWRVDWTPDGTRLVSCGRDKLVCVWDAETQKQLAVLSGHQSAIEVVRVSPDGRLAASADVGGEIWVWDLETMQAVGVLRDAQPNFNLRFHHGSLYSVGADITEWDVDFSRSPLTEIIQPVTTDTTGVPATNIPH